MQYERTLASLFAAASLLFAASTALSAQASGATLSARTSGYANPDLLVETEDLADQANEAVIGAVFEARPDLRIVDVRPREAYDEGHIPGAVHLGADDVIDPIGHVDGTLLPDAQLADMLGALGIDRETRVVLYDDRGGFHAARLFWMLEYFGHRHVAILNGGFPKWVEEGRDTTTVVPQVPRRDFGMTPMPRRLATADWLMDRRGDASTVVIDVRPGHLYAAGHIPWARNIPWSQNLTEDGTLKSGAALKAHFEAHGVTADSNVVVHCQVGKAAAHSYFALRLLGYPQVRSYDRSWAEWGSAGDLPVATEEES